MRRRRVVGAVVALAVLGLAPARADDASYGWPLSPRPAVTAPFDPPDQDWLPGHRGVDLAAAAGQTVVSAGDGVVVFAGLVAGRPVISIDHDGGIRTTYEPVDPVVGRGDRVRGGDPIGMVTSGHPGCPVTACLHWGARRGRDDYVDPLGLLASAPLVLKPLVVEPLVVEPR